MYNKAEVIGHLGQDPQTRTFENGSVTNFSVATTETWNDSRTGEKVEHTEWHNISVKGKFGEICQNSLRKGSKVFVVGKMRTRKWTSQEGQERIRMEIVADEIKFLDSPNRQNTPPANGQNNQAGYGNQGGDQGGYGNQYGNNAPQGQQSQQNAPQGQQQPRQNAPQGQQPGSYAKQPPQNNVGTEKPDDLPF